MKVPVLIPRIFDHPHTYLAGKFGKLKIGSLVSVPFGKENEVGVVWDEPEQTNKEFKLREINEKLPDTLNVNFVKFINWFSLYNLAPKGMVLKMCINDKSFFSKKINFSYNHEYKNKNMFTLNNEQKNCLDKINSFGNKFHVTLLQGVTGSGKNYSLF